MFVSVLMVRALLQICVARGAIRSDLLQDSGLRDLDLTDLRTRVPSSQFEQLCERAMALTNDAGIGLALGAEVPEHALQVVGYLVRSAPSLRAAYTDFSRYGTLLADSPVWALRERGNDAYLEYECPVPAFATRRMAHDWAVSLAHRCIKSFTSDVAQWPQRVELAFPRPHYGDRYAALLGCEVRFNRAQTAVIFPRSLLDQPQLHGDPLACAALRAAAENLLQVGKSGETLADRVRGLLRHERDLARVDVESLAQSAGLSPSALRRALAQEGLSPLALVDEARCQQACAELARADPSVKGIAEALGYADRSSFNRAFRRWTGTTPAAYRRARREADARPDSSATFA